MIDVDDDIIVFRWLWSGKKRKQKTETKPKQFCLKKCKEGKASKKTEESSCWASNRLRSRQGKKGWSNRQS